MPTNDDEYDYATYFLAPDAQHAHAVQWRARQFARLLDFIDPNRKKWVIAFLDADDNYSAKRILRSEVETEIANALGNRLRVYPRLNRDDGIVSPVYTSDDDMKVAFGFYLDIDRKTLRGTLNVISKLQCKPTFIIWTSASHAHIYWIFTEPFDLAKFEDRVWFKAKAYEIAKVHACDTRAARIAQVLRMPGSVNFGAERENWTAVFDKVRGSFERIDISRFREIYLLGEHALCRAEQRIHDAAEERAKRKEDNAKRKRAERFMEARAKEREEIAAGNGDAVQRKRFYGVNQMLFQDTKADRELLTIYLDMIRRNSTVIVGVRWDGIIFFHDISVKRGWFPFAHACKARGCSLKCVQYVSRMEGAPDHLRKKAMQKYREKHNAQIFSESRPQEVFAAEEKQDGSSARTFEAYHRSATKGVTREMHRNMWQLEKAVTDHGLAETMFELHEERIHAQTRPGSGMRSVMKHYNGMMFDEGGKKLVINADIANDVCSLFDLSARRALTRVHDTAVTRRLLTSVPGKRSLEKEPTVYWPPDLVETAVRNAGLRHPEGVNADLNALTAGENLRSGDSLTHYYSQEGETGAGGDCESTDESDIGTEIEARIETVNTGASGTETGKQVTETIQTASKLRVPRKPSIHLPRPSILQNLTRLRPAAPATPSAVASLLVLNDATRPSAPFGQPIRCFDRRQSGLFVPTGTGIVRGPMRRRQT